MRGGIGVGVSEVFRAQNEKQKATGYLPAFRKDRAILVAHYRHNFPLIPPLLSLLQLSRNADVSRSNSPFAASHAELFPFNVFW